MKPEPSEMSLRQNKALTQQISNQLDEWTQQIRSTREFLRRLQFGELQ